VACKDRYGKASVKARALGRVTLLARLRHEHLEPTALAGAPLGIGGLVQRGCGEAGIERADALDQGRMDAGPTT
jgi:hypothetical protein